MVLLLKYLSQRINKPTRIETKKHGIITGIITKIDNKMNITVCSAIIDGKSIPKIIIRGNDLRSFDL